MGSLPFLLVVVTAATFFSGARSQRPVLDLFGGGAAENTFEVVIGGQASVRLVTNPDTSSVISDPDGDIESVVVTFNGLDSSREEIVVDTSNIPFQVIADFPNENTLQIRIGTGLAAASNYSLVLTGLTYRYNLTSSALTEPERNITFTASDEVGEGNSVIATIDPREPNAEPPVFSSGAYAANIDENAGEGTTINIPVVESISATDPEGRPVTYSLSPSSETFAIDSSTGVVSVVNNTALDYEQTAIFELTVVAADQDPVGPLSAEVVLTINLNNINDNNPSFDQEIFTFEVPEEVLGAEVGKISATDADGDDLEYFFTSSVTDQVFSLDPTTQVITVRESLDYESLPQIEFSVTVTDGQNGDTATVRVIVINVLDGRPVVSPVAQRIVLNLDAGEFLPLHVVNLTVIHRSMMFNIMKLIS